MDRGEFITRVLKEVRFRPDHKSISQELAAHIEDRADWFCGQGNVAGGSGGKGCFGYGRAF